jgi:hypothetical protein
MKRPYCVLRLFFERDCPQTRLNICTDFLLSGKEALGLSLISGPKVRVLVRPPHNSLKLSRDFAGGRTDYCVNIEIGAKQVPTVVRMHPLSRRRGASR